MNTAALSPLAQTIADYLHDNPGVVGLLQVRELATGHGHTLTQLNEALRELKHAELADYCGSCRSLVSRTTEHAGSCPHGA